MSNRMNHPKLPIKDPKVMAHLLGWAWIALMVTNVLLKPKSFPSLAGLKILMKMTETLFKTFEDLSLKGKTLESASMEEITDLIQKNTPDD